MRRWRCIAPHRAPWILHSTGDRGCHICIKWMERHPGWVPEEKPEGREWRLSDEWIGCYVWEDDDTS